MVKSQPWWKDPEVRERVMQALRVNAERDHFADYEGRDECPAYAPLLERKIQSGSEAELALCDCGRAEAGNALALLVPPAKNLND